MHRRFSTGPEEWQGPKDWHESFGLFAFIRDCGKPSVLDGQAWSLSLRMLILRRLGGFQLQLQLVGNEGDELRVGGLALGVADCVTEKSL